MRVAIWMLALAGVASAQTDAWGPLRFLEGSWEAKTKGGAAGAAGAGDYAFRFDLKGSVLARTSSTTACTGPKDYNCEHGDLLYLYREDGGWKAIYFDNEGHVIHYGVTVPEAGQAVFDSGPAKTGPRYRLVYQRKGDTMEGRFEIQAPGQAVFVPYLEWSGIKKD